MRDYRIASFVALTLLLAAVLGGCATMTTYDGNGNAAVSLQEDFATMPTPTQAP